MGKAQLPFKAGPAAAKQKFIEVETILGKTGAELIRCPMAVA
jgi:hypothetical protein